MYSDRQSGTFTGYSLDNYRIVFNQTLQHSLIYRYITDLSKAISIKKYGKRFFTRKAKTAKSIAHEISKISKMQFH
ncbi:hypothetical protein T10_8952 [Trichinella papuae]|uniref:Uncharacterized protein n=1 Tax=Trichinella papuae TaxID=268474 RepID=A0A0V1MUB5_9BILA|nr:hypothetical protein T10_8952 [Trichinella papuae]